MQRSRRSLLAALPALAVGLAYPRGAGADPGDPVALIVPFAPGGGTDTLARLLAEELRQRYGRVFAVQNRPGEGTVWATNFVARSPPDGATLLMGSSTLATDASLYKKLPYDPARDLVLLALIATVPFVLVVNAALPVHSVADLVALARERDLRFGSGGIGAFHHVAAEVFARKTGVTLTHLPYRGTAPALADLVRGYVQLMFTDYAPAAELISSGKVRPLGVTTHTTLANLRAVPPLTEAGVPGFDLAAWQGVVATARTPPDIVAELNTQFNALLASPAIRARVQDLGMVPIGGGSPQKLAAFLQAEIVRWSRIVAAAGIARTG